MEIENSKNESCSGIEDGSKQTDFADEEKYSIKLNDEALNDRTREESQRERERESQRVSEREREIKRESEREREIEREK